MKRSILFPYILILLILSNYISAQEANQINGIVRDAFNGDTLIGVTILFKGTHKGTISNSKGNFLLTNAQGNYTLVFSYTGYETKEIPVSLNGNQFLTITLQQALTNIDEVKITSQRKFFGNMEYGRDIPTIGSKTIELQNTNNASDILHASVAGVWATKTSGSPGDHQKIRIRGQNSFFSSAEPLYVVDGVPVPIVNLSSLGIADLNIHDIENVTILRDASATALYGFQGGNGVVLIDSKKGGENEINFSTKFGLQWFNNFYDLMNTKDLLNSLSLAKNNLNLNLVSYYPKMSDTIANNNWQKEIFRTGYTKEYQLSVSGTTKTIKYYISGNYTDEAGILPNTNYKRYTFSSRISRVFFKKLAIDIGYRGSSQGNNNNQDTYLGNLLLINGITTSPCYKSTPDSLYFDRHGIPYRRTYSSYPSFRVKEPLQSIIDNNLNNLGIKSHIISSSARLELGDHLSINAMESLMLRYSNYYYNSYGTIVKSNEDVFLLNHQYNISYFNTFNKHNIDIVGAIRFYEDNLWWKVDTMQGELNSYSYLRNSMAAYGPNGSVIRYLASYVANFSYNYDDVYFISAVGNLSNIKEGIHIHYYSVFPSIALSLDAAKLESLRNINWLNNFKLYVNWGVSGNYPLNGLANDLYQNVQYTYGSNPSETYPSVLQLANHYLKHENTEEKDIGIKSLFLDKRLSINATYFIKDINNLIIQRQIPYYYGGGMQYINVGEIGVNGYEFAFEATPLKTRDFSWFLKFNFSTSHQIVKKVLNNEPMVFYDPNDVLMPKFVIKEGAPLGDIYGYKVLGKWTSLDTKEKDIHYIKIGNEKFFNADTTIKTLNSNDMVVIGNSVPKYMWNLSTTFQYKDFTLDLTWYAVQGVKKYNATRAVTFMKGLNREINNYIKDSISALTSPYFYQSSEFIDNASFIRLKTVTLSYIPDKEFYKHVKLRLSISLENLFTITKYRGYDPEATTFTDNNFSDNAIDRGSVPNPKAMYATISIKF